MYNSWNLQLIDKNQLKFNFRFINSKNSKPKHHNHIISIEKMKRIITENMKKRY